MTAGLGCGAGRGLRASPRLRVRAIADLALVLVLGVAACGGSGASGSAQGPGSGDAAEGGSAAGSDGSTPGSGADPAAALIPDRIAGLELEVVSYPVPDRLDEAGGPLLATMLRALDLIPAGVSLVIAVDHAGRLAIGRWELPGRKADAIRAAWKEAAGTGWQSTTLGPESALTGHGPDGSQAWAVARDGVFLYLVTDDPQLAEEAAAATR